MERFVDNVLLSQTGCKPQAPDGSTKTNHFRIVPFVRGWSLGTTAKLTRCSRTPAAVMFIVLHRPSIAFIVLHSSPAAGPWTAS
jgi:hypothetical protein